MVTTAFEDSNHTLITTLAQEAEFVTTLTQASPSVSRIDLGESLQGKPIYALKLGAGEKRPLVLLTNLHGDEQIPREAGFTLIRDLATSPAPEAAALLAERALYVIPTPNPDGFPNVRNNAAGIDPNRQWLSLPADVPETLALSNFLYEIDPVCFLDAHEWMHSTEENPFYVAAVEHVAGKGVREASKRIASTIGDALGGVPWYPSSPMGNSNHRMSLLGIPTVLTESVYLAETAPQTRPRRYADNRAAFDAWIAHMADQADVYEEVSGQARADIESRVGRTATTWPIDLLEPMDGRTMAGLAISAAGYAVPEAEWPAAKGLLDRHRIDYDEATRTVSLAQERAQVAVLILDPVSPFTVSPNAVRQQAAPIAPPSPSAHDPAMDLYENALT